MTTNAAKRLAQSLSKTTVQQADVVDPLAVALMRRLEERGIGKYHLEELEPDPVEERRRALRELGQFNRDLASGKYYADREAERQAEAEAERVEGLSVAARLSEALRSSTARNGHIPLNGPGVTNAIRQAIGAGATVYGEP